MFDADKWAQETDQRLRLKQEKIDADNAALVTRKEILATKGAEVWNQMKGIFRDMVTAYEKLHPNTLAFDVAPKNRIVVRKISGAAGIIEAHYDERSEKIAIGVNAGPGVKATDQYQLQLTGGPEPDVTLISGSKNQPITVEEIAKEFMKYMPLRS